MYTGKVNDPLLPGRKITLRGQDFVIPSLTLADAEELEDAMSKSVSTENLAAHVRFAALRQVIGRAMRANYPDMDDAALGHLLDYDNHIPAYFAAIGRDAPDPNAEARRPTPAEPVPSIGTKSTAS